MLMTLNYEKAKLEEDIKRNNILYAIHLILDSEEYSREEKDAHMITLFQLLGDMK